MGKIDEVKCGRALPDDREQPGAWFQTKSLVCGMEKFITTERTTGEAEGRWRQTPHIPWHSPVIGSRASGARAVKSISARGRQERCR